ncbi:hypothetical protein EEB14_35890 [Rhodococcus sp. WS4]|nr:hypothetical protein EEB14_35890 [Rhodococcus sp. WS4]
MTLRQSCRSRSVETGRESAIESDRPTPVAAVRRLARAVARAAMEGDPMFGTVEVTIESLLSCSI